MVGGVCYAKYEKKNGEKSKELCIIGIIKNGFLGLRKKWQNNNYGAQIYNRE